jgi:transcription factor IIIB subunit 2
VASTASTQEAPPQEQRRRAALATPAAVPSTPAGGDLLPPPQALVTPIQQAKQPALPRPSQIGCPKCGSSNIDRDEGSGNAVCMSCGTVLEENSIVASVQFAESSSGTSSIVGQYVSATATKSFSSGMAVHGITYTKESREITINNGRKRISGLAAKLRLGQHYVDSAHRLFLLAVQRNFVQGRRTTHVVAACLYIVCRTEKSPYLLIDFSDALQVNVYELGTCFLKFCRLLNLSLPLIEPTLYIHRFSSKLEFGGGEKTHQVAMTALRLVKRFKKDWIQTGRRPAGICAAALFLAAGLHGFKRTQKDIVSVTRICDQTLRKRLGEFANTPTAQLTPEEFDRLDLPEECDPPSFTRARELDRLENQRLAILDAKKKGEPYEHLLLLDDNLSDKKRERAAEFEEMYEQLGVEVDEWELAASANAAGDDGDAGEAKAVGEAKAAEEAEAPGVLSMHDDEMKEYLCSDAEVKSKTAIWEKLNKDYLEEQAQKKTLNPTQHRPRKKRKRGSKDKPGQRAVYRTAADAAYHSMGHKKTKKIDYEAMQSLFTQDESGGGGDVETQLV